MRLLSVGIPVIWLMIFSIALDIDFEKGYDYKEEMVRILDKRTEIISRSCFEQVDYEGELKKILEEPLLSRDIENLKSVKDTEIERISGYEILDYELLSQDHGGAVIRAALRWLGEEMADDEGYEYTVVLQHTADGETKMSEFYPEVKLDY